MYDNTLGASGFFAPRSERMLQCGILLDLGGGGGGFFPPAGVFWRFSFWGLLHCSGGAVFFFPKGWGEVSGGAFL